MRHIQIKILIVIAAILLSVSSYGQMQQVLRNGFVAATDSGVYYLQDGFSEWLKFKKPRYVNSFHFTNEAFDTVNFVSYNSNRLMIASYSYYIESSSGSSYNSGRNYSEIYNNGASHVWNYYYRSDGADLGNTFNVVFGVDDRVRYDSYNLYSDYYYRIEKYGTTVTGDYLTTNSLNSIAIADSVICVVGNGNTLIKHTINKTDISNSSYISVSGIHSRPTDSHQICYNPDDDEFIIVSDSGIVYSYDKTTLTTVDTIPQSLLPLNSELTDMCHYSGRGFWFGYKNNNGNGVFYANPNAQYMLKYTSSSTSDVLITRSSKIYIQENNYIYMAIMSYDNIKLFTGNIIDGEINENEVNLPNIEVFDLDYINYMP